MHAVGIVTADIWCTVPIILQLPGLQIAIHTYVYTYVYAYTCVLGTSLFSWGVIIPGVGSKPAYYTCYVLCVQSYSSGHQLVQQLYEHLQQLCM